MGDQGSDAIKIWVGIILTLFIVGILFGVVMIGSRGTNGATADISKKATTLSEGQFTSYDGQVVNGDQVLGIIRQVAGEECVVYVDNSKNQTCYFYEADVNVDDGTATLKDAVSAKDQTSRLNAAQTRSADGFIASASEFTGTLLRDPDTDAVTGLAFVKISKSTP